MTPEEIARNFIVDHYLESAFEGELESDLIKILSAAVAAEHQRTKEQCAKVAEEFECNTYEDGWAEMERGARRCAAAIRALP